jgi:cell division protein FtsB
MHIGKEEDVVEDTVTNMNNSIEENARNVLGFVRRILEK